MADVYEMSAFSRVVDVISNRVRIINQMMGFGVDGCHENPCRIRMRHGRYRVTWCGEEFASFALWDLDGADSALERVEGLNDGLWYALRCRMLSVPGLACMSG